MTYQNFLEKIKHNYNYQFILFLIAHITVWTIVPLLVAHRIGDDMAEHFYWGQEFQLGYYKHPPFSAWLVGIWFKIFPTNHFFYFLFCQLNIVVGFIFIYKLAKEILKDEKKAFIATSILEFVSFYSYKQIFFRDMGCFNHDYILLSVWPICAYYFYLSLKEDHLKNWILVGLFAGISMLSKYFSVIFLVSLFLIFVINFKRETLKKIFSFKIILSITIFLLLLSPHVYWLFEHDFVSFKHIEKSYQEGNAFKSILEYTIKQFLVFLQLIVVAKYVLKINLKKVFDYKIEDFNDRFIWIGLFSTSFILILLAFLKGYKIMGYFGTATWYLSGIFLLRNARDFKISLFKKILVSYFLFFIALSLFIKIFHVHIRPQKYFYYPIHKIAPYIEKIVHDENRIKINYVTGDRFISWMYSFYSTDHPSVLHKFDYKKSLWLKEKSIKEKGVLVICCDLPVDMNKYLDVGMERCKQKTKKAFKWAKSISWKEDTIDGYNFSYAFVEPVEKEGK
ncbi:MAG: hypothetical protein HEEMFOPI_01206 [Holosporales bacterium]